MSLAGLRLSLARADRLAAHIAGELLPLCEEVVIAGSIRRRRPEVGDIDLVILTRHPIALRERVLKSRPKVLADGQHNLEVLLGNGVRLDVWMAAPAEQDLFGAEKPTNFGSLLLCRTGSTAHNIHLVGQAAKLGLRWNPYWGVFQGEECLASATEEEVFAALQLPFLPPERRER